MGADPRGRPWRPGADLAAEEVAQVASARRERMLRVHRHRLSREDLEDCFSQATLELLAGVGAGGRFAGSRHVANVAARYLRASGAPGDYVRAIFAYNHAGWYVSRVQAIAARYRGAPGAQAPPEPAGRVAPAGISVTPTAVRMIGGSTPELAPGDGHLALIPAGVPTVIQAMLVAGNELQELPYGPAGHPDPRGAGEEDCSSTVNYVLYRAGVRPIAEILAENPLAQDYVRWGEPGPGRWVSIYATAEPTPHVFIVVAGLRLDTSHNGTDVGPNAAQDGPRWRLLDHIPMWAHWSIRHPPRL
jgi:hypothetical protein